MRSYRTLNLNPFPFAVSTPSPRASKHIVALTLISSNLTNSDVSPAQGIRVLRIFFGARWTNFIKNPTPIDAATLTNSVVKFLMANHTTNSIRTVNSFGLLRSPFLMNTNMSSDFNTSKPLLPPSIHFIRTQRRYNKRRYARVRAVSRPSFWAGAMTSTLATGMFWGSTSQSIDWVSTQVTISDMNTLLIVMYIIVIWKLSILMVSNPSRLSREINKSRRGLWHTIKQLK